MIPIELKGCIIFDREKPKICDLCSRMLDGSEREVWWDGTRMWLHRRCEDGWFQANCQP